MEITTATDRTGFGIRIGDRVKIVAEGDYHGEFGTVVDIINREIVAGHRFTDIMIRTDIRVSGYAEILANLPVSVEVV